MKVKELPVYVIEADIDRDEDNPNPRQFLAELIDGTVLWTVDPLEAMPLKLDEAERLEKLLGGDIKWLGDLVYLHKYPLNDRNGLRPKPDLNPVRNGFKIPKKAEKFLKRYGFTKGMTRNELLDELLHSHEDEVDYEDDMYSASQELHDEIEAAYLGYAMSFKGLKYCHSIEATRFIEWIAKR